MNRVVEVINESGDGTSIIGYWSAQEAKRTGSPFSASFL